MTFIILVIIVALLAVGLGYAWYRHRTGAPAVAVPNLPPDNNPDVEAPADNNLPPDNNPDVEVSNQNPDSNPDVEVPDHKQW